MYTQAPNLAAMLGTSGHEKAHLCESIDYLEKQVGEDGMTEIMDCGGDFSSAYRKARAFCANDDASGESSKVGFRDKLCDTAKALVCMRVRVHACENRICEGKRWL